MRMPGESAGDRHDVADLRLTTELVEDQARHRVVVVVGEGRLELLVEVVDREGSGDADGVLVSARALT